MQKELFDWFWKKEKKFGVEEIRLLLEDIKQFNCGAIDEYLSRHVDEAFEKWLESHKE